METHHLCPDLLEGNIWPSAKNFIKHSFYRLDIQRKFNGQPAIYFRCLFKIVSVLRFRVLQASTLVLYLSSSL